MPGGTYDKERVASIKYESGQVQQNNAPKPVNGKESVKTERAGGGKVE